MSTYLINIRRNLISPFYKIGSWYYRTAETRPFATAVITSGIKTCAADLFAQKIIEKRKEIDWKRNMLFNVFGFAYLGVFQYYLYNIKFAHWCSSIIHSFGKYGMPPVKVFLDQCIHHPFLYFPVFFTLKSLLNGGTLSDAANKYKNEIKDSLKALWSVWLPAQLINFSVVPRHMRVPYVALVSFLWTVVLSVMQSAFDDKHKIEIKTNAVNELKSHNSA